MRVAYFAKSGTSRIVNLDRSSVIELGVVGVDLCDWDVRVDLIGGNVNVALLSLQCHYIIA